MKFVEPEVTLVASTFVRPEVERFMSIDSECSDAEALTEFAGRACYQSFGKPNPATARNADYLKRTLFEQGHWSIAEHASATLYFEGVSRAFTHELCRHRHLSYSQLSQRFVDESEANIVVPPAIREIVSSSILESGSAPLIASLKASVGWGVQDAMSNYINLVDTLMRKGLPRKQAREAARGVLPNMTETRIVVTGNLRAWHEVIERRTAPDADAEMRRVMGMALDALKPIAPAIFGGEVDQN